MIRFLFFILLLLNSAYGCLWLQGTTLTGEYKQFENEGDPVFLLNMAKDKNATFAFRGKYKEDNSTEYKIVKKIINKEYSEAIRELSSIEKNSSNSYFIASNLSVAYELNGNLDKALFWNKEALKIDHNSHYGTEWLHLYILKSEIKLKNNPNYFKNRRLIELPTNYKTDTKVKIDRKLRSIKEIEKALLHQLRERMIFIKPKDKIVSELLFAYADILANTKVVEPAVEIFDMANEYGFENKKLLTKVKENYSKKATIAMVVRYFIELILLIIVALTIGKWLKKRNLLKTKDTGKLDINVIITILYYLLSFILSMLFYNTVSSYTKFYIPTTFVYFISITLGSLYIKLRKYVINIKDLSIVLFIFATVISFRAGYDNFITTIVTLYLYSAGSILLIYLLLRKDNLK